MSKRRFLILGLIVVICIIALVYFIFLRSNEYEVTFSCGEGCEIKKQYVEKNKKAKKPKAPTKDGYVFVEWQLDGKAYDFSKKVKEDMNLEAKWLPEKYVTVTVNSNSELGTTTLEVLAGTSISSLIETPVKEGYTFVGWYLNDKEYDLDKKVTTALEITAKWQPNFSELKIGDKVLIIGKYAEASTSLVAYHSKAIGWERQVVAVYEGREFPYAIGNEYGVVTGYFKLESLEKID